MHFYISSSNLEQMHSFTLDKWSYCEGVRLLAPLPLCLFSCLFSPGVMQTPFHRQNILCRSCQSVYPQAWVSVWGLTSNIENWPAAPTAFPAKHPHRECERERVRAREDGWGRVGVMRWNGETGGGGGGRWDELLGQKAREKEEEEERRLEDRRKRELKWVAENENEWVEIPSGLLLAEKHN